MWKETPYVVIGAHEPGKENKKIVCCPCKLKALSHDWETVILERDPESEKPTGIHMRIVFCSPDVMRKFGETIIKGAELWETEKKMDEPAHGGAIEGGGMDMRIKPVGAIPYDGEIDVCPFCGEQPALVKDVRYPRPKREAMTAYEVVCYTYKCPIYLADNTYYQTPEEAVEKWNQRIARGK